MKVIKKHEFKEVQALELGWSPVGKPLMTVNCFMVGSTLIDTAQHHMENEVIELVRANGINSVLLTHHHEDHSGNAAAIKSRFNIPVLASPLTIEKMSKPYKIFLYQHWVWGATTPVALDLIDSEFESGGYCFESIPTPGHSKDHTAFIEKNHGWLFSGDLYLGDQIKYFRADEKIKDQISSLKKILTYDFDALFCCHRPRSKNGKTHLARKLQYLEDFLGNVSRLYRKGLDEKAIMKELHLKEEWLVKTICFGNVSMKNLVRSVMNADHE